jgi:hypothetical protein
MNMQKSRPFWVFVGVVNIVISAFAFQATYVQILNWKFDLFHSRWVVLLLVYIACALSGVAIIVLGLIKNGHAVISFLELDKLSDRIWKVAGCFVFVGSLFAYFPVRDGLFRDFLPDLAPALWVIWVFGLLGCAGLKLALQRSWPEVVAVSMISVAITFQIISFFPTITNYPFSLTWSEGSNLYYASLINAKSLYGQTVPLSTLNPTYYLLRGIPFLIPGLPIILHRIWNMILWLGITLTTSALFARRLNLPDRLLRWLTAGWFFLFLLNGGAVHYEVQICAIILLWGVSTKHPSRSMGAVILASIWAGMSRLNWFPVPAMLAIALYLLEKPLDSVKKSWEYFKTPILWAVTGIGTALVSQYLYIIWSGNSANIAGFTTSFSSGMLWYRLLPNATYPLGILPGILIFTFPLILVIFESLRRQKSGIHPLRLLGLGSMLLVLLAGGIVVSAKIGGGSDLHNLDSFRILLALVSAALLFGRVSGEKNASFPGSLSASWIRPVSSILILVVLATPPMLKRPEIPDIKLADTELQTLQNIVQTASTGNKIVLFISQRQLLAFGLVDARFVPDYDVVELTEMAMAGNSEYLNKFYADIRQHRFDVIVSDIHTLNRRGQDYPFGEENNLWVDVVYSSLYCEYQPDIILEQASVQVMVPRTVPLNCP